MDYVAASCDEGLQSPESPTPSSVPRTGLPQVFSYCTAPFLRFRRWFALLKEHFGLRFVLLVFGEHLLKGFLGGGGCSGGFLVLEGIAYMQLQVGASTKSVLLAVSGSAWSLKPIFGMVSDTVVVARYRRAPWIVLTAILACASYSAIFMFGRALGPSLLCLCFYFARQQNSWTDLMIEATYTEKMQRVPEHAADILTWVWTGIGIATVAGVLVAGPALDLLGPFTSAALALPVSAAVILPTCCGWLGETPCTTGWGIQWNLLKQETRLFLCTLVLASAAVGAAACAIAGVSLIHQAIVVVMGSVAMIIAAVLCLPPGLWKPMLYLFLAAALSINTFGFVDNFYLDAATPEESAKSGYPVCVDCPHFSSTFYITVVGVCDATFMAVASCLFNAFMASWSHRRALAVTQIIVMVVSLIDIIQYERWNKRFGIPDTVFMVGKHAVQNTCAMLNFMPTMVLISKLCPRGVESTVFSLLAGFSNFGSSISWYLGALVLDWIGLGDIGKGEVDDFSNAWKACVINACVPISILCLLPFLIPNARMSDALAVPSTEISSAHDLETDASVEMVPAADLPMDADEPAALSTKLPAEPPRTAGEEGDSDGEEELGDLPRHPSRKPLLAVPI